MSTTRTLPPVLLIRLLLCLCTLGTLTLTACPTPEPSVEDTTQLRGAVRVFHKNLRWLRVEQAAVQVDESWRETFLGYYEEHGDDFHFVSLDVRKITMEEGTSRAEKTTATVEVEQKWYKEPDMTVKTERMMELWEQNDRMGWLLKERVEKDEWRAREKKRKQQLKDELEALDAKSDGDEDDPSGNDDAPTPTTDRP